MTSTPVLLQTPKLGIGQIAIADTTTAKTVYTGNTNGSKIVSVVVSSTDTSSRTIQLGVTRSATRYILTTVEVAANSGNDANNGNINMLSNMAGLPVDNDGQVYILLQNNDVLDISSTATVTTAKFINGFAIGGDF